MKSDCRLRKFLLLLTMAAFVGRSANFVKAEDRSVINVFLLAGQSNMAGADSEVSDPPGFQQTEADHATLFTTAPLPEGDSSSIYVPWGELKGHSVKQKLVHGPEVGFARALHKAGWRRVAIIKVFANFRRDVASWPWAKNGDINKAWMTFVDARMKELPGKGESLKVQGFLWDQGIDDAIHGKLALEYEKNLTELIASLRTRFNAADAPFVVVRSGNSRIVQPKPDPEGKSPMSIVRRSQVKVGESVPRAAWIDIDDLPNVNIHHFSADSQLIIGQRCGAAFLRIQTDVPN